MTITPDEYTYPFDPTGTAPSNKVTGEVHVITQQNHRDYSFIIPVFAPFFAEGVEIIFTDVNGNAVELGEGTDYYFGHHFLAASRAISKQVYGSISFINKEFKGTMLLSYQTLGGKWTYDQAYLNQLMTNIVSNPRISSWDSIVTLPATFPVIDHEWNLVDMVGMSHVVAGLFGIESAIRDPEGTGTGGGSGSQMMDHILDRTNPHAVTKLQVGLGNVQNYAIANQTEAEAGLLDNRYMSPLSVKQAIAYQATTPLTTHTTRTDNPHATTKAQVGLGSVEDFSVASQAEAEAGIAADRYMTPLTTKQAIDALANGSVAAHIADVSNPHQTTAAQVGLGNVGNYSTATQAEAETGSVSNKYMTPLSTAQAILAQATTPLTFLIDAHSERIDNPHLVTKLQVGLGDVENYGIANQEEAEEGSINDKYVTPLRVKQEIAALVGNAFNAHGLDFNNPHLVTKAQVGLGNVDNFRTATVPEAIDGTSSTTFMTPSLVVELINAKMGGNIADHLIDYDNPHQTTAAQVGAYTTAETNALLLNKLGKTETAANSFKLENLTVSELTAQILAGKAATAGDADSVGGKTYNDIINAMTAGTTSNSARLENRSLTEVLALAAAQDSANAIEFSGLTLDEVFEQVIVNSEVTRQVSFDAVPIINGATELYTHVFSTTSDISNDVQAFVTGGDPAIGTDSFLYYVKADSRTNGLTAINMNGLDTTVEFGKVIVVNGGVTELQVWMKTLPQRQQVNVIELTNLLAIYPDVTDRSYMGAIVASNVVASVPASYAAVTEINAFKLLNTHINRTDNPHGVTSAQLGLGSVQNYGVATQAEAEAGTVSNKYMTPLNTKQAITLQAVTPLNTHVSRTDNPHSVTKTQIGLGNVSNYTTATQAQAEAGTNDASFMTPLKTAQAIVAQVGNRTTTLESEVTQILTDLTTHFNALTV